MSTSRTYASLATLPAASLNDLAQGTIGYASVTASQTGITVAVDLTGLTVTVTLVAGRRIKITAECLWQNNTINDGFVLRIQEGASILQQKSFITPVINQDTGAFASVVLTPSVGAHTYKLVGAQFIGGTVQMSAASGVPAYILVEDIGI